LLFSSSGAAEADVVDAIRIEKIRPFTIFIAELRKYDIASSVSLLRVVGNPAGASSSAIARRWQLRHC
jgi:hypothetical protein